MKTFKNILLVAAGLLLVYLIFDKVGLAPSKFKEELEVLHKQNDSLVAEIVAGDSIIADLHEKDVALTNDLENALDNVKIVKQVVYREVEKVKTHDSSAVVGFYNTRYPVEAAKIDTLIPLNKPVLVSAAVDLVKFDGLKQEMVFKDSIIGIQDKKIVLRDSMVSVFTMKEDRYKKLVANKDIEIARWSQEFNKLEIQNKRLKLKSKFQRIASFAIIGGLTYMTIKK